MVPNGAKPEPLVYNKGTGVMPPMPNTRKALLMPHDYTLPTLDWMMERIDKRGPDECWPWLRLTDRDGYGRVTTYRNGRRLQGVASRMMYEVVHGKIGDPKVLVMHTCDNPPCCNPAHLVTGTSGDNARDSSRKGRRGLSPDTVWELRFLMDMGLSIKPLARTYGVTPQTLRRLRE